jgi:hypothetical protein
VERGNYIKLLLLCAEEGDVTSEEKVQCVSTSGGKFLSVNHKVKDTVTKAFPK